MGGPDSWLGPPTSDEFNNGSYAQSNFRSGYITWNGSSWQAYPWPSSFSEWKAEYFNLVNPRVIAGYPAFVRNELNIDYDWGNSAPNNGRIGVWNNFAVRWTRSVHFSPGRYRFRTYTDDGVRLWVGNKLLVDDWNDHVPTEQIAENDLNGTYTVKMEYYDSGGAAVAQLGWGPAGGGNITVIRVGTTDGNGNAKTSFRPWDSIQYWAEINNSADRTVPSYFEWQVTGSRTLFSWSGYLNIPSGTTWRHIETNIPSDAPSGTYTFRVSSNYNGQTSSQAITFTVSGVSGTCPGQYRAEYYNNHYLSGSPTLVRCEDWPINHDWGGGSPGNGVGNDNFSARWTGRAHISEGTYTFIARTDDGMKVWLNNEEVFNKWWDQPPTEYRKTLYLSDGEYNIKVEYYEAFGGAVAQFRWEWVVGSLYRVRAKHSGKCLDVSRGSLDSGAEVIQWDCHGGDNQRWNFVPAVGGYYEIRAMHSGKCLDVWNWSQDNGAPIIQWDCHGGDNQLWSLVPEGDYYKIAAKHSGKCLDVTGWSQDSGAKVIQWDCHGGDNQLWRRFTPVTIDMSDSGGCPDITLPLGVGIEDVKTVAGQWKSPVGSPYDQDGNTIVSVRDIMIVGQRLGEICP